jgi:hypothetical protein
LAASPRLRNVFPASSVTLRKTSIEYTRSRLFGSAKISL